MANDGPDRATDRHRLWLMTLLALWALAWAYSWAAFATTEPEGSGFTRGSNRIMTFLGWQAIAAMIGFPAWIISRAWPKGAGVRRLGRIPILMAGLLAAGIAALIGWAVFFV